MGGVLVILIGYQMLHGRQSAVHQPDANDQQSSLQAALSVAITPLAIPILSGPGTLATAMNFASTDGEWDLVITIAAFALLCLITYAFFTCGDRLVRYLGASGLSAITRIMGLILAVIGVQMLIVGIAGAIRANH